MTHDPKEVIREAQSRRQQVFDHTRPAAEWFHEREENVFEREEAAEKLADHLSVSADLADDIITELAADLVDPVIQIETDNGRFVGVHEYVEGSGWYGYIDFHDKIGERKRVVCAQCIKEANTDHEVSHATGGEGAFSDRPDASFNELSTAVEKHYHSSHGDLSPEDVETGASLLSGSTIGGNSAFHAGNHGAANDHHSAFEPGDPVTDLGTGTVSDGEVVKNSSGSLAGASIAAVPSGAIMYHNSDGSAIPSGYVLADGLNGTPDLRNRYVKGANSTTDEGSTGGTNSVTLSTSELPGHDHGDGNLGADSHSHGSGSYSVTTYDGTTIDVATGGAGAANDTTTSSSIGGSSGSTAPDVDGRTSNTGSGSAHQNEPAFTELRAMMKT